ncbi:MAG: tetraacyldisaccharide 4'-kinase [Planctomycetota bacterium]
MAERRPPLPGPAGRWIEAAYRGVVGRRNRAFDGGKRVTRFRVPVISVGNLSVGGTGKTPMVKAIVEQLVASDHQPAIAMRGYGSARGTASDEQLEYLDRFPDVPVVAQPNRVAGLTALLDGRDDIDCVVLDDGFQHRFVARDLDIVLLDASRDPTHERCLPAGWLREPMGALGRAHVAVLTHCERVDPDACTRIENACRAVAPHLLICRTRHGWSGLRRDDDTEPTSWLRGKRVVAVSAIGNNEAFLHAAEAHGATIVSRLRRRDHHRWTEADARRISTLFGDRADAVITTEKDWVKLRAVLTEGDVPVVRPLLTLEFDAGAEELRSAVFRTAGRQREPERDTLHRDV